MILQMTALETMILKIPILELPMIMTKIIMFAKTMTKMMVHKFRTMETMLQKIMKEILAMAIPMRNIMIVKMTAAKIIKREIMMVK